MIEGATEAIPLGSLFDLAKYGGTSAVKSVLKQAGIEATEEAVAYVLNFAADKLARDPNAAFSWSELAKAAAMGGFSGGIMGTGATAVYHANHYDGGGANFLTPEEIAAYNAAEQERIQQEELFAEIERDWYADEEAPAHTEEPEDDWDEIFGEEEGTPTQEDVQESQFYSLLLGVRTQTGIEVKDVSHHVLERAETRKIDAKEIGQALTVPLDKGTIREDRSQQFIGEYVTVVINVDTGKIVTVWPTSAQKRKKLKEREQE